MESYTYDHLPSHLSTVHIALFTSVTNAAELRARIVQAATQSGEEGERAREEVNFAFVDARLVSPVCSYTYIIRLVYALLLGGGWRTDCDDR